MSEEQVPSSSPEADDPDPSILDRNLVRAACLIIEVLDSQNIHPFGYWRIFKAVEVLTDGEEDGRSKFDRVISNLALVIEPYIPLLAQAVAQRQQAPSPGIPNAPEGVMPGMSSAAYLQARLVGTEIVAVQIMSEEHPTEMREHGRWILLEKCWGPNYIAAREGLKQIYSTLQPALAAKFPIA